MNKITFFQYIFLALFIFSCKNSTTEKVEEKVEITTLAENTTTIQAIMELESKYETSNSNINLEFRPNSFDDAFTKANQDFANGTGIYDIVMQYNFSLASFVQNDYVYSLDNLLKKVPDSLKAFEKDLFPNSWKEVCYYYKDIKNPSLGIQKVGYPFASNTMFLAYNKEMFDNTENRAEYQKKYNEELSVPTTWEQFYKISEFFTNKEKDTYGVCLQGATGGWVYYEWMNFLFGMGGKVMDKEYGWQGDASTQVLLNTPEAMQAIEFYKSLKAYNAGNFTNVDSYEQVKLFSNGNVAMSIVWSDLVYDLVKQDNGTYSEKYGFAPIPGNKSLLAGGSFFINKDSKHPKETMDYIIYLMQPKNQTLLARKGLCSALKTVYDDPEVQKIPYSDAVKKSLERGTYMLEAGPDANMISEKITTYLQKYWNDEMTSKEALEIMQKEIEEERKKIFSSM